MKSAFLILTLIIAQSAFASTLDSYSLPLDGSNTTERFSLAATQTKTLYRDEIVDSTCYRTVRDGWDLQCRQVPELYCYYVPNPPHYPHPGNGRPGYGRPGHGPRPNAQYCETRFRQECHSVPRYVNEAYSCRKTVSIPYEVFDYDVKNNVAVTVKYPMGTTSSFNTCNLNFSLFGTLLNLNTDCSDYIVIPKRTDKAPTHSSSLLTRDSEFAITAYETQKVTAPTAKGIKGLKLEGQTLVFRTGDLTKNPNFSLKLYTERRKLLKSDVVLINRNLSPAEYTFEKTDSDNGIVRINLSKLFGGINRSRKHIIRVDMKVLTDLTGAINQADKIPARTATSSITVND